MVYLGFSVINLNESESASLDFENEEAAEVFADSKSIPVDLP